MMFSECADAWAWGFGNSGGSTSSLNGAMPEPRVTGFTDNAHNLPLHVMAEFGLVGLDPARQPGCAVGDQDCCVSRVPRPLVALGLALVLAVHSMLEYPLWYTFFLGVAAIVLGLGDSDRIKLQLFGKARSGTSDSRRGLSHRLVRAGTVVPRLSDPGKFSRLSLPVYACHRGSEPPS